MNTQNYINHIALVLDASGSMQGRENELVKVADNQIAYLAQRSKELDQETRVTVYTFSYSHNIKCLIYDKDVLRIPSIAGLYQANGQTALIDATVLALDDLALTPEKYGEHAFLIYVLTDGMENDSRISSQSLRDRINALPEHWTLATFVPDQTGVFEAKNFGFPKENIAVWDTVSSKGISEVGERIKQTTEQFMQNRTQGIRGSRTLFVSIPSVGAVTQKLNALSQYAYELLDVRKDERIDTFVSRYSSQAFQIGKAYYQLTKSEIVQWHKQIVIFTNGKAYTGAQARNLLGLPDHETRVRPSDHRNYEIFIQSTSPNRKLIAGTKLLILK